MLPTLRLTKQADGEVFYLPAAEVRRIESKGDGSYVITDRASYACKESAADVSNGYNHSIAWKESQVVQAQLNAMAHQAQKEAGLVIAQPRIDLNGR